MNKRKNLILYTIVIILTISNQLLKATGKTSAFNKLCSEESNYRKKYAAQMLSYMNSSVNPCDDFYEYACGNWKNVIEERTSTTKRNNILDIAYKLNDIVEKILQRPNINDVAPEYSKEFEMAKEFYQNCLKADLYPMRASQEYLTFLKEIGGFPAADKDWNSENFNWINMSAHLSHYDVKNFVNEHILPAYPFAPYFKIPDFGFDIQLHEMTVQNSRSNAYKENEKQIRSILTIYGVKPNRIDVVIAEIFGFLNKVIKVSKQFNDDVLKCEVLSESMKEPNIMAIKEKFRVYYDVAWQGRTFEELSLKNGMKPCLFFYEKLDKICEENKEAAANYLSLKFLFHMDAALKEKEYQKEFCISSIKSSMLYLFDHLYMKLYFNNELRKEINYIVKEIRQSLRLILQEADWLDETTRTAALLKESKITEYIGRYEDLNVAKLLLGELKKLEFVQGSFEANYMNLRKFKQHMNRFGGLNNHKLSKTIKPLQALVGMQPNSFYYFLDNSIYVMAAILMPPAYNKEWPNSLKFGTLGFIIGHEFTHGFDTYGARYDESGKNYNWWSKKSAEAFHERAECYVNHYGSYFIPEIRRNINGVVTNNENIADNGGLREALMAYRRIIKNQGKDYYSMTSILESERMPGIDLEPEQLFFLGFAQMWCSSYKEAHYWEELTNTHTIDKYRVLGALSNSDDFAKSYNCPVGSKMNTSSKKCKVW